MKFIFWQNIISIHQSAFLKALADKHSVTLVAEQALDEQRKGECWSIPDMGKSRIILSPTTAQIEELLKDEAAYHVFSGIDAYPMVYRAFKLAVDKNCHISVMAEPYEWAGMKGFLRRMKYSLLFMRYGRHIDHFFTTGNMGMLCYQKAGFPVSKLHQWGYFTEQSELSAINFESSKLSVGVKLLYVGRIDANKNILPILENFDSYGEYVVCFSIIGDGPLYSELQMMAKSNPKIKVLGRLGNDDAKRMMREHDYLVLPSLYDGWGAVVNEALSVGTRVLCSDACGASILLDGKMRGAAFSQDTACATIKEWSAKGRLIVEERNGIVAWAKEHASGVVAADYFKKIIEGKPSVAPWLQ